MTSQLRPPFLLGFYEFKIPHVRRGIVYRGEGEEREGGETRSKNKKN